MCVSAQAQLADEENRLPLPVPKVGRPPNDPVPFPTTRRIIRRQWNEKTPYPDTAELESWAQERGIILVSLIPTQRDREKVLRLLYLYRDLDGEHLDTLPCTDLVEHRVHLKPDAIPYSKSKQKNWGPVREWWLKQIVSEGIAGGVYESTIAANNKLSPWNAQAVIVDKVPNPTPSD